MIFKTKHGGRREIPKNDSTVSFNWKLSGAEELKIIKYAEESNIHSASNYYRVSRPTIRYWIK